MFLKRANSTQGKLVTGGSFTPHKLSGVTTAFVALQCFAKHCQGMKLDNVTAVTYINKLEGTHFLPLCQFAMAIWELCI